MKLIIVEDEAAVARNLRDILADTEPEAEVLAVLESVSETMDWLKNNPAPDLGFFDIQLADGSCFEIFEKTKIEFPVVFTTAYDSYALQAFKVNSVDYLLKPIRKEALRKALDRYEHYFSQRQSTDYQKLIEAIRQIRHLEKKEYKKNFLVYIRDRIVPVPVDVIAFFFMEGGKVYCLTFEGRKYVMDESLDRLQAHLDPDDFFRANRQFIVSRKAVISAAQYFQRKLKIILNPDPDEPVLVSKNKVSEFKQWIEGI
ncbi:MAG: LytTR family DNA-binding domain-containing protein [Bacteroidota bacterium]|nr:LytTR family DNA-binding domain-containing protein [Bacteroidota bacterium]